MHTENRFNLIDEAWIPVVDVGKVSLKQIFSNSSYRALGGNPIQKIALTKFLLAIAQAAYTPNDEKEWLSLGADGLARQCLDYLHRWYHCFWLYGDQPFLQVPEIVRADQQSFGAVLPEVATGNTTLLTETQKEKDLSDAERALLILTLMGFGLGGKKTDNKVVLTQNYQGKYNNKGEPSTGKSGTSLEKWGFLHTFLIGNTLQETLWFNQFTQQELAKHAIYPEGIGVPPWEKMPKGELCETAQALQKSLMGRLIPVSRFCLLTKTGLHYSEGIAHLNYKEGVVDPSVAVDFSAKEPKVIWVDPQKRPWRYLTALLAFMSHHTSGGFDCYQIQNGLNRARQHTQVLGIWSGGLKVSYHATGEQYLSGSDDFVESQIMLESSLLGATWYQQLESEMNELNKLSNIVRRQILAYFESQEGKGKGKDKSKSKSKRQAEIAVNLYWQLCERHFPSLLVACQDFEQTKVLRKKFAQCVYKTYHHCCPKETARQLDAWALCHPNLSQYLNLKQESYGKFI